MKKEQLYWVDWYRDGFCYRSTHSITKEQLKEIKKQAKYYGDTIKVEKM